eukprot:5222908-Alexandrium_andersonii.AAC.1
MIPTPVCHSSALAVEDPANESVHAHMRLHTFSPCSNTKGARLEEPQNMNEACACGGLTGRLAWT